MIYAVRFATWSVWGMLVPFMAVWLFKLDVLSDVDIGVIVGAAIITNRVGSLAFVRIVSRHDKRTVIIVSQVAAIVALGALFLLGAAGVTSLTSWLAASVAFGLANSVGTLAQVTFIVEQFDAEDIQKAFSYENVALNLGAGLAPLLSAMTLANAPDQFAIAPAVFALAGIGLAARIPRDRRRVTSAGDTTMAAPIGRSAVGLFLAMNFLTLLAYAQFYDVFPAYASDELGTERIGILFTASSVTIVLFQVLLTRFSAKLGVAVQVMVANLAAAVGTLLLLDLGSGWLVMCLAVWMVTIAEMMYGPLYQTLAVRVFAGRTTLAMGAVTCAWGVAESLATFAGLSLIGAGLGNVSLLIGAAAAGAVAVVTIGLGLTGAGRRVLGRALPELAAQRTRA